MFQEPTLRINNISRTNMDLHFILTAQSGNKLNFQIQLLKYVISRHRSWNKLFCSRNRSRRVCSVHFISRTRSWTERRFKRQRLKFNWAQDYYLEVVPISRADVELTSVSIAVLDMHLSSRVNSWTNRYFKSHFVKRNLFNDPPFGNQI